jgi:hypothetical protein
MFGRGDTSKNAQTEGDATIPLTDATDPVASTPSNKPKKKVPRILIAVLIVAAVGIPGAILASSYLDLSKAQVQVNGFVEYAMLSKQNLGEILSCTSDRAKLEIAGDIDTTSVGDQELPVRLTEGLFSKDETATIRIKDTQPPVISLKSEILKIILGETIDASELVKSASDPVDGELEAVKKEEKARGTKVGEEVFYDKGWYIVDGLEAAAKPGSHKITVVACDRHGNRATREIPLNVVDPLKDVTLKQNTSVLEYSKKTVDPLTLVTCSDPKVKLKATKIDLASVGEQKITYTLTKQKNSRDEVCTFVVRDTKGPVVEVDDTAISIDKGASFEPYSNVKSATDPVDGELARVESEPADNGDGWYTVKGDFDVNVPSKYFFTVVASDNHGNRVEKEFSLEVKEPPAPVEQTAASTVAVAQQGNERSYVLNKNTHKFHYPSCRDANRIADHNRWDVHMTREEIVSMGYSSCAHCNP